jgi:hypothetical protein
VSRRSQKLIAEFFLGAFFADRALLQRKDDKLLHFSSPVGA